MAPHLLSPPSSSDYESSALGKYPTLPPTLPIPNKTLHIANLLSTTDSTGTYICFAPLSDLLKEETGFKRLKVLSNRNGIGCFAIAYYENITTAWAAMAKLQGVSFTGSRGGLKISFATAPKPTICNEPPRALGQAAVPQRVQTADTPWAGLGRNRNHLGIPTPVRTAPVCTTRGPGMVGDKLFVPGYRREYTGMKGSIHAPGGDGSENRVDLKTVLQPSFVNGQENTKVQDNRDTLTVVGKAKGGLDVENISAGRKEEVGKMGRATRKKTEEGFQLRGIKGGVMAKGIAEAIGGGHREEELKQEELKRGGDKAVAIANDLATYIPGRNPTPVEFDKSPIGHGAKLEEEIIKENTEDLSELIKKVEQLGLEDWGSVFGA